jgi:hypothetical protein
MEIGGLKIGKKWQMFGAESAPIMRQKMIQMLTSTWL